MHPPNLPSVHYILGRIVHYIRGLLLELPLNPKRCGLFGGVLFGEMKFVLSNFLSNEDLSISYES